MSRMNTINNNGIIRSGFLPSQNECKKIFLNADAVCFDVDSTVIQDEGLDQLAAFYGKKEQVTKITHEAMRGGLDFQNALRARLNLIQPSIDGVQEFTKEMTIRLTKDIDNLVHLLHHRGVDVHLISGGFHCVIDPIAEILNIPQSNVFTNRLKFFYDGEYAGFDETHPCSRTGGKGEVIRLLKKRHGYSNVVMIGDGATDLEACPPADAFIGFGGNVVRPGVKSGATWYVYNFDTLIDVLKNVNKR